MRTLFTLAPFTGSYRREHGAYSAPSKAYTNSIPDQQSLHPGERHTLAFYTEGSLLSGSNKVAFGLMRIDDIIT